MEDDADRISQLPEHIMEKILFLLPAMDAISMSFTSNTWKTLWNSLPLSHFDFKITDRYNKGSTAQKHIARINESLKILKEDEDHHRKRIIDSFRLRGILFRNSYETSLILESWMKLVTNNYIKELELHFKSVYGTLQKLDRLCFPYSLGVDATSLVVLRLSYVIMEPYPDYLESSIIPPRDKKFPFLREISLFVVKFNSSVVDHLLSKCPSLQSLKVHYCSNLKSFQICGAMFPKLNTVSLVLIETLDYKIELPNLQTLCIEFVSSGYTDLSKVCCSNVKTLRVCAPPNNLINTNQYLEKLTSDFPLLEDLTLSAAFDSAKTKISSHQLKKLTIIALQRVKTEHSYIPELNLDTPSLLCFFCNNRGAHIVMKSTRSEVVDLERIGGNAHLATPWFLELQQYLPMLEPHALNVTIMPLNDVAFSVEELGEDKFFPLPEYFSSFRFNLYGRQSSLQLAA
ncbi:F-box/LRR-repeat protein At3g26922-like [Argentina anserina]|uniref:F-box/LRR-repeat protein At3g26922-like n=1 Tax=Argentina anserina TaxID=57926 RepID=UPI0021764EC3|nr:F-box/LRR-repeat protein At3g26922-like [Potentilla anserina]